MSEWLNGMGLGHVEWTEWILSAARVSTCVVAAWFVVAYWRRAPWEKSQYGRNVMSVTIDIAAVAGIGVFSVLFHSRVLDLVAAAAWLWMTVALLKRRRLLLGAHGPLVLKPEPVEDDTTEDTHR